MRDPRFLAVGIVVAAVGTGMVIKSASLGRFFAVKKKDVPERYYRIASIIGRTEDTPQIAQMSTAFSGLMVIVMGLALIWLAYF